jgi:predicted hydrocarbon binding protein
MKRKQFLKSACTFGFCGCFGASLLTSTNSFANAGESSEEENPDWRIDFMQSRYRELLFLLADSVDNETLIKILHQLGANCGEDFAIKYKNNPDGFFDFIKSMWAESVEYDKEAGIVRVNERVRDTCNCPFIPGKDAPAVLCNCSIGTQKRIYESLFGKPVDVTLEKSILRGDERCSFTIRLI